MSAAPVTPVLGALPEVLRREFATVLPQFRAQGMLTTDGWVYPLGTDSKVLAGLFEQFAAPVVHRVAALFGRQVIGTGQTSYPDFTLATDDADRQKIAVDVKSAYRRKGGAVFTLGSHKSYLRDGRKSIAYPYEEYAAHWVIGFLYSRQPAANAAWAPIRADDGTMHTEPYDDLAVFVQERHRIASDKKGSGNTDNIASIRSNDVRVFADGRGPFATYPPGVFAGDWGAYPRHTSLERYLADTPAHGGLPGTVPPRWCSTGPAISSPARYAEGRQLRLFL